MKRLPSEYRKSDNPGVKPGEIRNPLGGSYHEKKIQELLNQTIKKPNGEDELDNKNRLLAKVTLYYWMLKAKKPEMRVDIAKHINRQGQDGFTRSLNLDSKTLILAFIQYQQGKSDDVQPPVTIEHIK